MVSSFVIASLAKKIFSKAEKSESKFLSWYIIPILFALILSLILNLLKLILLLRILIFPLVGLSIKDNKFNRGRLEGVVYRDKEGKLRVGYPD